eukprot:1016499-Prymnesium_polylepis.1
MSNSAILSPRKVTFERGHQQTSSVERRPSEAQPRARPISCSSRPETTGASGRKHGRGGTRHEGSLNPLGGRRLRGLKPVSPFCQSARSFWLGTLVFDRATARRWAALQRRRGRW